MTGRIAKVRKRDGRLVDFDETKIADAIFKAAVAVGGGDRFLAEELAGVVTLFLEKRFAGTVPGIEEIQDTVEKVLIETGHARTAKAFILYRDRRARARARLEVSASIPAGGGPRVGNPAKGLVSPWAKSRIAESLVREADLDARLASEVATRVEERVFAAKAARVTTSQLRALVEGELFHLGYSDRVGRQALLGLPRHDVDRLLRGAEEGPWRPDGPRDLKSALADSLLAQYAMAEVYGDEVGSAHMEGRIHILDAGSPVEWIAASGQVPATRDPEEWVETTACLASRLSSLVSREVCLEGVAAAATPWAAAARNGAALGAVRRLLAHPLLHGLDRLAGRFRLCLPLPAAPEDEGAYLIAEGLVREHWARFREGALGGLPEIALHLPAAAAAGAGARRALLPALAAAAETGRVRILFDRDVPASLASTWFRIPGAEAAEERAACGGAALGVSGAVAVNLHCVARECSGAGEKAFHEALEASLALGIKALRQKRTFLAGLMADPSGPLYRCAGGAKRTVAGDRGFDFLHLAGARAAAEAFLGATGEEAARWAGRVRSYAALRAAEEGRAVRLKVCCVPDRDGEAEARFATRERDAGPARAGLGVGKEGALRPLEPFPLPPGCELPGTEPLLDPASDTLFLRFPRDAAPSPETLLSLLASLASHPRLGAVHCQPWPDRRVRVAAAGASDL